MELELFPDDKMAGVFRGFREGRMEFHADLALPYHPKLHEIPMHGQFLLVQLENPDEAVLGRITSLSSEGRLTTDTGEQYSIRAAKEKREVTDTLRQDYLKYRVNVRILGIVRLNGDNDKTIFAPSHRRLPHVGSPVGFVPDDVLQYLIGHYGDGAEIGFFALGEYIYAGDDPRLELEDWMLNQSLCAKVRFPIEDLVSRRTFIFARAGYGKSNLNKLLFSTLYSSDPVVKRRKREIPVGSIIFDPDGEYFWPDHNNNPGLCDVPKLQNRLVIFTSRAAPSPFYQSFVAGGIKLDIRQLKPSDVISIALPTEKQEQQNVNKLRAMNTTDWANLVDLIEKEGHGTDLKEIGKLMRLDDEKQQMEALAARSNMVTIVRSLHDRSSQLMSMLKEALSEGKLCVIDISQLRGGASLILSGLILRRIFNHNQEEFIKADSKIIPTIAVVEEAQSVLNEKSSAAAPYIEWVKEGRKYDLGALLITQQPGSIPTEILSQGDNWFIFHLLSAVDLQNVRKANAHFSEDILSSLLNEPIRGQGVFWSGVSNMPYPIPLRVLSFSQQYQCLDQDHKKGAIETYASQLREKFAAIVKEAYTSDKGTLRYENGTNMTNHQMSVQDGPSRIYQQPDPLRSFQQNAIQQLSENQKFWNDINNNNGIPWGVVIGMLSEAMPKEMDNRGDIAHNLIPSAMNQLFGENNWDTEMRGQQKKTCFIFKKT
jgi:uncharacterized protein